VWIAIWQWVLVGLHVFSEAIAYLAKRYVSSRQAFSLVPGAWSLYMKVQDRILNKLPSPSSLIFLIYNFFPSQHYLKRLGYFSS